MIPVILGAFVAGVAGAVGAKIGTDYVYPWALRKVKDLSEFCDENPIDFNEKQGS